MSFTKPEELFLKTERKLCLLDFRLFRKIKVVIPNIEFKAY